MRPYFNVGEEVILCSEAAPNLNGEYVVLDFVHTFNAVCPVTKKFYAGFSYRLSVSVDGCFWWNETALRKKHKPSDQSFKELIKSTRELKV